MRDRDRETGGEEEPGRGRGGVRRVEEMDKPRGREKVLEETRQPLSPSPPAASSPPRLGAGVLGPQLSSPPFALSSLHASTRPRVSADPRGKGVEADRIPRAPTQNLTPGANREGGTREERKQWGPLVAAKATPQAPRSPLPPPTAPPGPMAGGGLGREEGATSKPILISPIMSAGRRLEKASGTLNKKNVANAIIEGGSRRAGIASL